jgi:hypothetical protein
MVSTIRSEKYRGEKIAVAFVHGIGDNETQSEDFADNMKNSLKKHYSELGGDPDDLVTFPCCWGGVVQQLQDKLWANLEKSATKMSYTGVRKFAVDFIGDIIAYQPTDEDDSMYERVHEKLRMILENFSFIVGDNAPLCIISHSLGTIVSTNYIRESQNGRYPNPHLSNIAKCKTLKFLYTLGSPLAIYSISHKSYVDGEGERIFIPFGAPVKVPRWINFYDRGDVVGYPLSNINEAYRNSGVIDREVDVGGFLNRGNPSSHMQYWNESKISLAIAQDLYDYQIGKLVLKEIPEKNLNISSPELIPNSNLTTELEYNPKNDFRSYKFEDDIVPILDASEIDSLKNQKKSLNLSAEINEDIITQELAKIINLTSIAVNEMDSIEIWNNIQSEIQKIPEKFKKKLKDML